MPEHDDPIRLLEDFGTGGVTGAPTDPAEVRRLGDRRRIRRRTTMALAVSVVAVAAAVTPIALLSERGGDGTGPATRITAPPTPSSSATVPGPTEITFPGVGISVTSAADTSKLVGTTAAFKTFIAGVLQRDADDGCPTPEVTVKKYDGVGYALGGVGGCDGYQALWVDRAGQWQEGMGTQDAWDCETLDYLGVPRSFAGECFDEAGDFGPHGAAGVDLGMSAAEVRSGGGTIDQGPAGSCSTLVLPHLSPLTDSTDGYLAPGKGVVLLAARPGMKTPERIGLGSSKEKVQQAYPDGRLSNGYWVVSLGQGTKYEFGLGQHATVEEMLLADEDQPCTS